MLYLITSYYNSNNEERQKELDLCLQKNIENNYIEKIYLLNDKIYGLSFLPEDKRKEKIIQIIVDDNNKNRLGFDYAISFINTNLHGKKCILSNSDIYFDDTLKELINYNLNNVFCAITRYENNILYNPNRRDLSSSQDTWIFLSPLKLNLNNCKFKFGHPGCDNRIAYLAKQSNYQVINPAKTIKTHHLHKISFRKYNENDRVKGDYHFIKITTL
jgi:hypothetical protein